MPIETRVELLKAAIEKVCCVFGLNLTVYNGKIGFVDQEQRKIVALWEPAYALGGHDNERPC